MNDNGHYKEEDRPIVATIFAILVTTIVFFVVYKSFTTGTSSNWNNLNVLATLISAYSASIVSILTFAVIYYNRITIKKSEEIFEKTNTPNVIFHSNSLGDQQHGLLVLNMSPAPIYVTDLYIGLENVTGVYIRKNDFVKPGQGLTDALQIEQILQERIGQLTSDKLAELRIFDESKLSILTKEQAEKEYRESHYLGWVKLEFFYTATGNYLHTLSMPITAKIYREDSAYKVRCTYIFYRNKATDLSVN